MRPTSLLLLRRKAYWGFLFALKIRRLRPGANPRTWVPKASTPCSLIRAKNCGPIVVVAMRAVIFVLIASSSPLPRVSSPTQAAWNWHRMCTRVVLTRCFVNRTILFPISPALSITQQMLSGVMKSWYGCILESIAFLFQSASFYLRISGLFNSRLCSPRLSAHIASSVRRQFYVYKPEIKSGL
jgi:hypothetical protein